MATIDKGSITATASTDPVVFKIAFDFTDDASLNPDEGWKVVWKHAEFDYNTNMSGAEFTAAASAAMQAARKPSAETNLENALKATYGVTVVRVDPSPTEATPMKVEIASVDASVVMKTQEVTP